ncbi:hypothetical protein AAAK34_07455 [Ottowia caeni]
MSILLSPLSVNGLTLSNRLALSPMCQYKAVDGLAGAWHQAHYGARAIGGVGLVMLESTAISAEGRITHGCLGLWNDAQQQALGALVANGHNLGTTMGIQLNHAGRKGSAHVPWQGGKALGANDGAWPVLAPSALAQDGGMSSPSAMTRDDIERTVAAYAASAQRAVRAGFDVVELHLAHGYLLHQFLSPSPTSATTSSAETLKGAHALHCKRFKRFAPCCQKPCPCSCACRVPMACPAAGR